jgi:hypothetical protein
MVGEHQLAQNIAPDCAVVNEKRWHFAVLSHQLFDFEISQI